MRARCQARRRCCGDCLHRRSQIEPGALRRPCWSYSASRLGQCSRMSPDGTSGASADVTREMAPRIAHLAVLAGLVVVVLVSPASVGSSASAALKAPRSSLPGWASTGFIAYRCRDELCLMRPDGSGKRYLLSVGPSPQWDPAVSPQARMLTFRGYYGLGDGEYALYVVDTNGCAVRRLTRSIAGDPTWSPDGRWI